MRKLEALFTVSLLCVAAFAVYLSMSQQSECNARGGSYVRGLFWFECVAAAPQSTAQTAQEE